MSDIARHSAASRSDAAGRYDAAIARRILIIVALFVVACLTFVVDIVVGSGTLSLGEVAQALISPAGADPGTRFIVWDLRMPMTLMAVVTGVSLALAGLLMQTILDNPLAEPFTLGVSSAAGFGAAIAIAFGLSAGSVLPGLPVELITATNAFLFALLAAGTVLLLSKGGAGVQSITLLGIALHFVFSSLLSLVQYMASADQLQGIIFWVMGSLQRATWLKVAIAGACCVAIIPLILVQAWSLTALRSFGEQATVFGVRVRRLRVTMLVLSAVLAGTVTSVVGIIGFVGLVAPHVARMLVGEDHRFSIAATIAVGAVFTVLASLATKVIIPGAVLPLGMVTALTGLPFFIALVLRNVKRGDLG